MAIIQKEVVEILSKSTIEGTKLFLPDIQLDRKTYTKVNDVLLNLGGKWNSKQKAHLFDSDPSEVIQKAIKTGSFTNAKKDFELFETPEDFARELVESIVIWHGDRCLEPSAGNGRIARAMKEAGGDVRCIEIQQELAEKLKADGFPTQCCDFLEVELTEPRYDVIVMNPPFSKGQDIAHVMHAWDFLKPGGNLVAVMSAGVEFKTDKKTTAFRKFVDANEGYFQKNSEGQFKASGTMVNTVTLWLTKS